MKNGTHVTLADLKPGDRGHITHVDATHGSIIRLMVLGLVEEVPVLVENRAIGGDPIEVSVFGASISIRKQDAYAFRIAPTTGAQDTLHG